MAGPLTEERAEPRAAEIPPDGKAQKPRRGPLRAAVVALRPQEWVDQLGTREVQSILLEGGPHLTGAFLDAGEVDWMHAFVAPMVAGGRYAKPPVEGEGIERIADARHAIWSDVERIGDDFLISARFQEW